MASVTAEQQRAVYRRTFVEAAKGIPPWQTARIVNRHGTPGVDWRGSSKGHMADMFAAWKMHDPGAYIWFADRVINELTKVRDARQKGTSP